MIRGKKKEQLSVDAIFSRIDPYEIYRYYLGYDFTVGKPFNSPFRNDSTPSFSIDNLEIGLHHMDYGDMHYRGSCIDFVMQLYHIDFPEALKRINFDFGLGIGEARSFAIRKAPVYKVPRMEEKKPPVLQVIPRAFTHEELKYWEQYHQGLEDLKAHNIFVPKTIFRNKEKLGKSPFLTFCYWFPEVKSWKIYRPHASKRLKKTPPQQWKWDTNVPFTYIEHLDKLGADALVAKSKKDFLVLRKALQTESICITSSENPACLSDTVIQQIKTRSERQIAIWDNDEQGKKFSWFLTREYGFQHCNVPDPLRDEYG